MKILVGITILLMTTACADRGSQKEDTTGSTQHKSYVVVEPGTHPSLLFSKSEVSKLRQKIKKDGFAKEMWDKVETLSKDWTMGGDWHGEWITRGMELDAKALLYQINGDEKSGREALKMMKGLLDEIDPHQFIYEETKDNFFLLDDWPKAFAYAYDWLYPLMTEKERANIADQLALWCKTLYEHTEQQWWQGASYNVGAIPVGALGLLCVAIQGQKGDDPEFNKWLDSAVKRIRDNYFPTAWRQNGICFEGPDYAQYLKNPIMFGEALRRNGGEDIVTGSGGVNAMQYLRFQWKPGGTEAPIGDNTTYGRRVFQSIYLLGIGEMRDKAGLHTFLKWTPRDKINPILGFILYPEDLKPESAEDLDLITSKYFELTPNRAGYFFSRSKWDDEEAAFFAFVTRDKEANHQHYDMNSFLFSAFGEDFADHVNLYAYRDSLHGLDKEHNMVIVDGGGIPGHDAMNGAGDDASLNGYLTGLGTGHFGDYVRGDAAKSYKDISLENSTPAVRADRYGAFIKQGPNPYVIMIDDIQKSEEQTHTYDWLWHSKSLKIGKGDGSLDHPLVIPGKNANAAIGFVTPDKPTPKFEVVEGNNNDSKTQQGLISVRQKGKRVKYFVVGAAWQKGHKKPVFENGPEISGNKDARSLVVKGEGFTDYIVWQPQEEKGEPGVELSSKNISTNALLSVVRTNGNGKVLGYLMGDGTKLTFKNKELVKSSQPWSVSADTKRLIATGKRRAYDSLPPLSAKGQAWLPDKQTEVRADGHVITPSIEKGMAQIGE